MCADIFVSTPGRSIERLAGFFLWHGWPSRLGLKCPTRIRSGSVGHEIWFGATCKVWLKAQCHSDLVALSSCSLGLAGDDCVDQPFRKAPLFCPLANGDAIVCKLALDGLI